MGRFVHGLALRGFRGIGQEWIKLSGFVDFNFFIGANNAGKSTVLDFLNRFISNLEQGPQLRPSDIHIGSGLQSIDVGVAILRSDLVATNINRVRQQGERVVELLERLAEALCDGGQATWMTSVIPPARGADQRKLIDMGVVTRALSPPEWQRLWSAVTGQGGGNMNNWVSETVASVMHIAKKPPSTVRHIPAMRRINKESSPLQAIPGAG